MTSEPLEIYLLGDFRIQIGERTVPDDAWKLRKAAGIIKLLALEPTHRLHREQIIDALWPDLDPDAAANNFRYALHVARRILDAGGVPLRDGEYLRLGEPVWVDVQAFEQAADRAWRGADVAAFRSAVTLYGGELLPSDLYEERLDMRRTALRTTYQALLARLARLYEETGDSLQAIDAWQRLILADPVREEGHARLMLLYAQGGRRQEALVQYDVLTKILERELGVEPDAVSSQLARSIRDGTTGASPPSSSWSQRTNLPAQTTSLIGREREVAEIRHELVTARLVTLTGPGGAGKTRLAITVAEQSQIDFVDGVALVQLASVNQADLVVTAIVQTLGIREEGSLTLPEALTRFIGKRAFLLVLDNFEHVLQSAPLISRLLEECPRLTVLVTSRIPLHLRGERVYPLRSLSEDASVTLFIQRSHEVHPGYYLDAQQMDAIREICRRLDGLPLAIELAAARSNILSPTALLARLADPLALLTSGPRDLPDRQQTLRTAIAWSYDLLDPDERSLFRQLAVFRGGWTLQAVEFVCPAGTDVLSRMTTLVDSSLVEQIDQENGEPRFRMLETIREFGLEQLAASGAEQEARRQHAGYFADLIARAPLFLRGPEQPDWLDRLEREHPDIQTALDWLARHDVRSGLQMIAGLWRFWWLHGHLTIGKSYCEQLLELADDSIDPAVLAAALTATGVMVEYENDLEWDRAAAMHEQALRIWLNLQNPPEGAYWSYICLGIIATRHGNYTEAVARARQALEYAQKHNQEYGQAGGMFMLGLMAGLQGQVKEAVEYYDRAITLSRSIGDPWLIALNTHNLGVMYLSEGRYAKARSLISEALAIHRQLKDTRDVLGSLINLGWIELHEGRISESYDLFNETFTLAHQANERRTAAAAQSGLGSVALHHGSPEHALGLYVRSLAGYHAVGDPPGIASALDGMARAYAGLGNPCHSVSLYASAGAYRANVGIQVTGIDLANVKQDINLLRAALSEDNFRTAWESGESLTPDQVLTMENARAHRIT